VDPRAQFEELYRTHAGAVLAFVRRRTVAGAEDVVSEVFLIAWRRLEDVPERPVPWLLGVATRVLANRRRAERRASALRGRLANEQLTVPGLGVAATVPNSTLLAALALLSERDQEVLVLVAWDGLDRAQAAEVLGISTGAFAVRLHRARRRLVRQRDAIEGRLRDSSERSAAMEAS
jgi:RNA polymerase sigma-70 factor, ECF subfamily